MPSTVKMIAVVDGKETVVGRCHPGQARILRKQGLALWDRNRVVLQRPPAAPTGETTVAISVPADRADVVRETVNEVLQERWPPEGVALPEGWEFHQSEENPGVRCIRHPVGNFRSSKHMQRILADDIAEANADGLLTNDRENPKTHKCSTGEEYLREVAFRRDAGHEIDCADNPRSRVVGFIDVTDNLVFEVNLTTLKESGQDVRKHFVTAEARRALLGVEEQQSPEHLTEDEIAVLWESAPVSPLNASVGQPIHNEETGRIEIPINGIDPMRVAEIAGRAVVGRPPRPLKARRITDWTFFQWPRDHRAIVVYGEDNTPEPNPDGEKGGPFPFTGYYRRVGNRLFRMFPGDARWDVSEMNPEEYHGYRPLEEYRTSGEEGWMDEAMQVAESYAEGLKQASESPAP
jgi:hypothetical protein